MYNMNDPIARYQAEFYGHNIQEKIDTYREPIIEPIRKQIALLEPVIPVLRIEPERLDLSDTASYRRWHKNLIGE